MRKGPVAYNLGEPVWAHVDGFPWWPARIVRRDEISLDEGEEEPQVNEDEVLVEFFNDDKRFCSVPLKNLRPFLNSRHANLNRGYDGEFVDDVRVAAQEAKDYVAKLDASKQPTFSSARQGAYDVGETVWARPDGFPWWPGRVVRRDQITLKRGQPVPKANHNEVLVEFFNNQNRIAAISLSHLRPFRDPRYANINRNYRGEHAAAVRRTVKEANEFASTINSTGAPKGALSSTRQSERIDKSVEKNGEASAQVTRDGKDDTLDEKKVHAGRERRETLKDDQEASEEPMATYRTSNNGIRRRVMKRSASSLYESDEIAMNRNRSGNANRSLAGSNAQAKRIAIEKKSFLSTRAANGGQMKQVANQGSAKDVDVEQQAEALSEGIRKSERSFRVGEAVWAFVKGYPWWPARIVLREEISLDKGEEEPDVDEGEVLVEFFNDEKRFAVLELGGLRPFFNKRYATIHRRYNGQYVVEVRAAVKEAEDYAARVDLSNRPIVYL